MFWSRDHVKKFVDYTNTERPNIRFTFKIEDKNSFRITEKKAFKHQFIEKAHAVVFLLVSRVLFL